MKWFRKISGKQAKEFAFQVLLFLIVFVFYSFEHTKGHRHFRVDEPALVLFINYAAGAYAINYFLLPVLYKKKYLRFCLGVVLVIAGIIVVEEEIIEQIYFPDTWGRDFRFVFNLLALLPVVAVFTGFKFAWDALNKQKEVEQLKEAVQESELQFLKSQINPHFLFNNLNNLYAHALEESPKTPQIILELSSMMRYMLYECKEELVPLEKELHHLENFVNLSALQLEGRGEVVLSNKVNQSNFRIAPLLLSVFVENAFKHSLSSISNDILIEIDLDFKAPNVLTFSCSNNYSSHSNTSDLTQGIGLRNVEKRLNILYPNAHELRIEHTEKEYRVLLTLHLHTLAET